MKKSTLVAVFVVLLILMGGLIVFLSQPSFPSLDLYSGGGEDSEAPDAHLLEVPFVSQKRVYCSEASAAMILQYYGHSQITQEYVHENIGTRFEEMLYPLQNYLSCDNKPLKIDELKGEIDENDPVMIRLRLGDYRHTVVVVGYEEDFIYVHDPGVGKYKKVDARTLLEYWIPVGDGHMAISFD